MTKLYSLESMFILFCSHMGMYNMLVTRMVIIHIKEQIVILCTSIVIWRAYDALCSIKKTYFGNFSWILDILRVCQRRIISILWEKKNFQCGAWCVMLLFIVWKGGFLLYFRLPCIFRQIFLQSLSPGCHSKASSHAYFLSVRLLRALSVVDK